jgi:tRNA(Ile)-lysidine synthase
MIVVVIGVAVSGGADSVYLLHDLLARGLAVVVLHVNHMLRGAESDGDETFVRELGAKLGLEVLVRRARVAGGNVEQEARRARYGWFRELTGAGVVDRVALGHTRSDQAETVLFRFLRGSGTAGLAGIRPETSDGMWRPLLHLTREEVRESLRTRGIAWREDSSNRNLSLARNRIRCQLLPALERDWNPGLADTLAQTADWALEEERYWAAEINRLAARCFREAPGGLIVNWPRGLAAAVERRLVRHAIERAKGDLRGIEFGHVESVRAMRSGRLNLPGVTVERSFGESRMVASGGGEGGIAAKIRLELLPAASVYNGDKYQLDWERLSPPLMLRSWLPGDRYRRAGRDKEERLKLLFQKARVPVWERRSWPVLVCGGNIAWTREFGPAAGFERTESTQTVLLISDLSGFSNRNP